MITGEYRQEDIPISSFFVLSKQSKIGIKRSTAQITECYKPQDLIGRQVLGVIIFPPKQVAAFISEVLVLGVYAHQGVVLIKPNQHVGKGDKLG